ncbi:uncharacterized protein AB9W97_019267 isoform 3-T3 [Spinachia spinachia]
MLSNGRSSEEKSGGEGRGGCGMEANECTSRHEYDRHDVSLSPSLSLQTASVHPADNVCVHLKMRGEALLAMISADEEGYLHGATIKNQCSGQRALYTSCLRDLLVVEVEPGSAQAGENKGQ